MEMAGKRVSEAGSLAILLLLCASSRPGLAATEDISRVSETGAVYPTVLVRIQHFWSLRIRIQGFGELKIGKKLQLEKNLCIYYQKLLITCPEAFIS